MIARRVVGLNTDSCKTTWIDTQHALILILLSVQARPDMVLIEDLSVNLFELTIPTNTYKALQAAKNRKSEKPLYLQLVSELEDRGLSVSLEIRSLGHFTSYAVKFLTSTFSHARTILSKLSKISIAWSYHIFNSRNSLSWDSNKPFYTL